MREDARETIEKLSGNDIWLLDHMITAFWHTFGVANGLFIQKDDVEEVHYPKGPKGYRVKAEVMRAKLDEYVRWLESYQEKWGSERYNDAGERERASIYTLAQNDPAYKSREMIIRMIELLQV